MKLTALSLQSQRWKRNRLGTKVVKFKHTRENFLSFCRYPAVDTPCIVDYFYEVIDNRIWMKLAWQSITTHKGVIKLFV
jgi:hypothetical protein